MQGKPAGSVVEHNPIYMEGALPDIPYTPKTAVHRLDSLIVKDLSYHYEVNDGNGNGRVNGGSAVGVMDINLNLQRGSFTVIIGRIGSGKTTLLKALLGLLPGQSGEILWNGKRVTDPTTFFVPPRMAYTGQVPRLFSDTLRHNILMWLAGKQSRHNTCDEDGGVGQRPARHGFGAGHSGWTQRDASLRRTSPTLSCRPHVCA